MSFFIILVYASYFISYKLYRGMIFKRSMQYNWTKSNRQTRYCKNLNYSLQPHLSMSIDQVSNDLDNKESLAGPQR